jgi:hypothetical protein
MSKKCTENTPNFLLVRSLQVSFCSASAKGKADYFIGSLLYYCVIKTLNIFS